jgi:hypothetical protein
LARYRDDLRVMPRRELLADREYWAWELADLERAGFIAFEDNTRAFFAFKLAELDAELARRQRLGQNHYAEGEWPGEAGFARERYEAVKAAVPLPQAVTRHAGPIELRPSGERLRGRCPFGLHEDRTPSFTLYPDDHFYCFGCGIGGSVIDFLMALYGIHKEAALVMLETEAGLNAATKQIVVHRSGGEDQQP